ncbi:sugar ABC transporter permease [Microbacterium sp. PRC9]|uniref:carbohydrate ABC transporter permease n=1 Tax=Microbacterium sp. PRC9 TaxID=2962591 RepID=UPI0028818A81|nr:sugar ABC transporter permease [Microbacterium sp. PRC9]MDT0144823.1 sugar ABC transporter permease [Microbacterium sp. PRC9]
MPETSVSERTVARDGSNSEPSRPRRRGRNLRTRLVQIGFILPAVIYMILFFGYPVIKNFVMGFQEYTATTFFTGEAPWIGWANYQNVMSTELFGRAAWNTLIFTVGSIAAQFAIGLAIALFFNRKFVLSGFLRSLLLLPWLIPMVAGAAVWRWILDADNGVLNRLLSSIPGVELSPEWLTDPTLALIAVIGVNVWLGIPFNATILYGGLQEIPQELYEAGALDGATGWRAFRHITWPMLRPVVTVTLVLGVVYTVKVIDVILGVTNGGPANSTQTIATLSYEMSFRQFDFGAGAALGNILILISLVFAVVYLRLNRRAIDD